MTFGRGLLLWLIGIPLPIILLLALFWHNCRSLLSFAMRPEVCFRPHCFARTARRVRGG
jgi:hypothetical protein